MSLRQNLVDSQLNQIYNIDGWNVSDTFYCNIS